MSQNPNLKVDEIDLSELFAALWSQKLLIGLITSLSIFLAGHNLLTTKKKFTAKAIFQIEADGQRPAFNLPGELGALASIAGFNRGGLNSNSANILERVTRREFIVEVKENLAMELDPFFNTYNPDYKDPLWKSTIKQLIGWEKTKQDTVAIIEGNIIKNYKKNVKFEQSDGRTISISVTHVDPKKSAFYANAFMEEIRRLVVNESVEAQQLRLNYLSETLADALQDMEKAQKSLKNYALANSAMAQENFISDSLKLDQIRMEKRKVREIADLLLIIDGLVKSGNLDTNSYAELRSSHPLVDDIDFRRILGMSETISAWTWPKVETIKAISATLRDRMKRLDVNINNIEENAKIYATSAEGLAKLRRDAKIAEATYTVLIEQVKSQSLAAGFQPETFRVFEYATPPLGPSSPKRNLTLAMGASLGIFIGCALALFYAIFKGVYYTRSALISAADAKLALRSKSLRRLSRKSISDIIAYISKHRIIALDEAIMKLANKTIIYVLNSGGRTSASAAARLLATQSAQSGWRVLLCDTTGQIEKEIKEKTSTDESAFPIHNLNDNLSVITGATGSSFFTSKTFNTTIKGLTGRYDQIFICTNNRNSQLGLMALLGFAPGLVMISGLRKTKKSDLKNIKSRQTIDLLFHD